MQINCTDLFDGTWDNVTAKCLSLLDVRKHCRSCVPAFKLLLKIQVSIYQPGRAELKLAAMSLNESDLRSVLMSEGVCTFLLALVYSHDVPVNE